MTWKISVLVPELDLRCEISDSLLDDLDKWSKEPGVFSQTYSQLSYWTKESNENDYLVETAKKSVSVVDFLLIEKVPEVFI